MFRRSEMKHTLDKIIISLLREEPQTYYERRKEEDGEKEGAEKKKKSLTKSKSISITVCSHDVSE